MACMCGCDKDCGCGRCSHGEARAKRSELDDLREQVTRLEAELAGRKPASS